MRKNKRDHQADKMAIRNAVKAYRDMKSAGKLTRAEALTQIAKTDDSNELKKLSDHQNKHVKHAALYKSNENYRQKWQEAKAARTA